MTDRDPAPSGLWNLHSLIPAESTGENPAVPPPPGQQPAAPDPPPLPNPPPLPDARPPDESLLPPAAAEDPARTRNRHIPVIIGAAVAALLIAAAAVTATRGNTGTTEPAAGPAQAQNQPLDTAQGSDGSGTDDPTGSQQTSEATQAAPSETADDTESAALEELSRLRDEGLAVVSLDGRYTAQLASKSVGIVDPYQTTATGSHTFQAADILAEHQELRDETTDGTTVVVLLSTDFGKRQLYRGRPLWVTFALGDFPTRAAVTRWCASRFADLTGEELGNQCAVRKLEPPRAG